MGWFGSMNTEIIDTTHEAMVTDGIYCNSIHMRQVRVITLKCLSILKCSFTFYITNGCQLRNNREVNK